MELGSGLTQREVNAWLEELPRAPGETLWLVVKATAANPEIDMLILTDRRLYGMRRAIFKPHVTLTLRHGRALVGRSAGRHLWIPVDGGDRAVWALFETVADLERFSQVLEHAVTHGHLVAADSIADLDANIGEPPVHEEIFRSQA